MNTQAVLVGVIVAIAIVLFVRWYVLLRSQHLRGRFGPEYDRAVRETGDVSKAESMLSSREHRVEKLPIRALSAEESGRFSGNWRVIQARFVDDPRAAVTDADVLIREVMSTRGYPMSNWEQRVADISVDHPHVVENYRTGHDIAIRHERGEASTEDLRRAMIAYRELFAELVEPPRDTLRRAG